MPLLSDLDDAASQFAAQVLQDLEGRLRGLPAGISIFHLAHFILRASRQTGEAPLLSFDCWSGSEFQTK